MVQITKLAEIQNSCVSTFTCIFGFGSGTAEHHIIYHSQGLKKKRRKNCTEKVQLHVSLLFSDLVVI